MSTKHVRVISPNNVSYLLAVNPSMLMTSAPPKNMSKDQIKRANSQSGSQPSTTKVKFRPPSADFEKSESQNKTAHKVALARSPSPKSPTPNGGLWIDVGPESYMTPRKVLLVSENKNMCGINQQKLPKERHDTYEESVEQPQQNETLKHKILENEVLRSEIFRLESELRNCKKNLKDISANEDLPATDQLSDKEFKDIIQSLDVLLNKSQEAYSMIEKKCSKLEELVNYIESGVLSNYKGLELKALTDQLRLLSSEFKTSSQLEIEVSSKSRELVKKKLEMATLKSRYQKLSAKCEALQRDMGLFKQTVKVGHIEKNMFARSLTKEKTLNRETQKKLDNLQKTLQILTEGQTKHSQTIESPMNRSEVIKESTHIRESTHDSQMAKQEEKEVNTSKLREALSKLVKQNEALRRIIHVKEKEISKLNDNLSKTVWKLDKANIRIEKLRNQKSGHKMNDGTQDEEELLVNYSKNRQQEAEMLSNENFRETYKNLPKNLDFRFGLFEERYTDLINDVLEGGSQAFGEHVRLLKSDDEIKEEVMLISSQFISYRNFAEKMNRMIAECYYIFSLKTFNEVMLYVSAHMRQVLGAGKVRVWINEPVTGTLKTMESADKELKCLINKGLVADVIKTYSSILRRSHDESHTVMEVIYPDGTSGVEKAQMCLLVPLKTQEGQLIGVLEVSKFTYDAFLPDLDYFAQVLGNLCVVIWKRMTKERVLANDLKFKETFFDAFNDLTISKSQKEFSEKAEYWVSKVFQSRPVKYIVVHDSILINFSVESGPQVLKDGIGIIGKVATQKKPLIVLDTSSSVLYSENVDIDTTFPLYTTPVILKKRSVSQNKEERDVIVGILQMVMNHKCVVRENATDESFADYSKTIDPNMENLILKFTQLVAISYDLVIKRAQYDGTFIPVYGKQKPA